MRGSLSTWEAHEVLTQWLPWSAGVSHLIHVVRAERLVPPPINRAISPLSLVACLHGVATLTLIQTRINVNHQSGN